MMRLGERAERAISQLANVLESCGIGRRHNIEEEASQATEPQQEGPYTGEALPADTGLAIIRLCQSAIHALAPHENRDTLFEQLLNQDKFKEAGQLLENLVNRFPTDIISHLNSDTQEAWYKLKPMAEILTLIGELLNEEAPLPSDPDPDLLVASVELPLPVSESKLQAARKVLEGVAFDLSNWTTNVPDEDVVWGGQIKKAAVEVENSLSEILKKQDLSSEQLIEGLELAHSLYRKKEEWIAYCRRDPQLKEELRDNRAWTNIEAFVISAALAAIIPGQRQISVKTAAKD